MKTLLVIALILLGLYLIGSQAPQATGAVSEASPDAITPANVRRLQVMSLQCAQNSAYYSAAITVRNITGTEVSFPKAFIQFTPKGGTPFVDSVGLQPSHLPGNAMADAELISRDADGKRYTCSLLRIQDVDGATVN
jgi:hypothetical protein